MPDTQTRSTGELLGKALDDILRLIRKEFELLKLGLVEAIGDRLKAALILGAALSLLMPGVVFLLIALALWMPGGPALGFTVVGVSMLVAGAGAIWWGIRLFKRGSKDSNEALDRVKEDARWARERVTR